MHTVRLSRSVLATTIILAATSTVYAQFAPGSGSPIPAGSGPNSVALGDFNADGKPDLAVANVNSNNVSVLLGDGTGGFSAPTNFAVGTSPIAVAVANFNSGTVSVLLGLGAGTFAPAADFTAGSTPSAIAVGDFNGDTKLDLA